MHYYALAGSVLLLSAILVPLLSATAAPASTPTGIMVPLFSYMGPTWAQLIGYHEQYPTVPMVAVVDPFEGPAGFMDPAFTAGVVSLQDAGIPVLGYMATHYANTNVSTAEGLITKYWDWYHVNGVMIDELNNTAVESGYVSTLTQFAYSLGMTMTVGNPGADIPPNFVGTASSFVVYENAGVPTLSFIAGWHAGYAKSNFIITAYDIDALNTTWVIDASHYLGYLYVTNGIMPDPYSSALPSYMATLMATLASIDG